MTRPQATAVIVIAGVAFALGAYVMLQKIKSRYEALPWWKKIFIRLMT